VGERKNPPDRALSPAEASLAVEVWQDAGMNFDDLKLIVVPTDFSESSSAAMRAAVQLAQAFHASIEVFHVNIDPSLVLPPPADVLSVPIAFERVLADTAEKLERVVGEVRQAGVVCKSASEMGRSHTTIVEQARRSGAGLIVMGSHGRHGLSHALLGSVAEKVVQHAPCAVLVVPVQPGA
jgi:nucleotide-binding universal stress UspA family protein